MNPCWKGYEPIGMKIKKGKKVPNCVKRIIGRGLSSENGLTDQDLNSMLRHDRKFAGVFMKDEIPKNPKQNAWYIVNMDNSYEGGGIGGTHWVCFKNSSPMIYFDPLVSKFPPLEIMEHAEKDGILYDPDEIQNISSTACGWFCVACILSDKGNGSSSKHFEKFTSRFSKNTLLNDKILYDLLRTLNVF